jgi:hypothetical protein
VRRTLRRSRNTARIWITENRGYMEIYAATTEEAKKTKQPILRVWLSAREFYSVKYIDRDLIHARSDGAVALFFVGVRFVLTGPALHQLVRPIEHEYCAALHQYDATRWRRPTAPGTPIIEKIEVDLQKGDPSRSLVS